jgi:hypothetical protein
MPNRARLARPADHRHGQLGMAQLRKGRRLFSVTSGAGAGNATAAPIGPRIVAAGGIAGNSHLAMPVNRLRDKDDYEVDFVVAKASVGH